MEIELEKQKKEVTKEVTEKAIEALVESCQELNADQDYVIKKIVEKFALSQDVAEEKMKLYWKS